MRPLLIALLCALPLPTLAQTARIADSGCHLRVYTRQHLAQHPLQAVAIIGLRAAGENPVSRTRIIDVMVRLRDDPEHFQGTAYCNATPSGALDCLMEGDAGAFTLTGARDGALRLAVALRGMAFEGSRFVTISGTTGDDQVFLIPPVSAGLCR